MKVYLGFAKRDLPPFKRDDLFHWQAHEPKGGDLVEFYWREAEVADAEEADALYSPVDSAAGMVARLRMQPDGTLLEIAENAPVLRVAGPAPSEGDDTFLWHMPWSRFGGPMGA